MTRRQRVVREVVVVERGLSEIVGGRQTLKGSDRRFPIHLPNLEGDTGTTGARRDGRC